MVTPAGPITWAPGFGPNGVVASVQTAPTTGASMAGTTSAATGASTAGTTSAASGANTAVAGFQSGPQTGAQGRSGAGVSNLPSTNTGDTSGLLGLGSALMALGASFLLRLPTKRK